VLADLRVHKPAAVARMLNIPITRLETWVRMDRVSHLRADVLRGVELTAEDLRQIGRMRPELMGGRRGGRVILSSSCGPGVATGTRCSCVKRLRAHRGRASTVPQAPVESGGQRSTGVATTEARKQRRRPGSWTYGYMGWSVRGAGDGNRTRMAAWPAGARPRRACRAASAEASGARWDVSEGKADVHGHGAASEFGPCRARRSEVCPGGLSRPGAGVPRPR
jgi:hypothetical protein